MGKKAASKMLLKLAIGVINILQAAFSYESVMRCFSVFVLYFWVKGNWEKAALKMLVKLT